MDGGPWGARPGQSQPRTRGPGQRALQLRNHQLSPWSMQIQLLAEASFRTSLVVQWLRIGPLMQGSQV